MNPPYWKMEREKTKGLGLCRVSTAEQGRGTSLESQEEWVRKKAAELGSELVNVIKKEVSGVEFPKEITNYILEFTKTEKISYLFVYQVDRLSRELLEGLQLIKEIEKRNIIIVTSDGIINPHDLTGSLMLKQKMLFSEYENDTRRERVQRGITTRLKNGQFTFKYIPFGYERDKKYHLILKPECIPILKFIFDTFIRTKSFSKTRNKTLQRYNQIRLTYSRIRKILKNPVYIGYLTWGHYGKDEEEFCFHELKCIDENTFYQAQSIIEQLEKRYHRDGEEITKLINDYIAEQGLEYASESDYVLLCCPKCKNTDLVKNGREVTNGKERAKFICKNCGHAFRFPPRKLGRLEKSISRPGCECQDKINLAENKSYLKSPDPKISSTDLTPWMDIPKENV